jgi:hypothetical protein
MILDFIGHEIRPNDDLWIIKGDMLRIEAYRDGDNVIPKEDKFECLAQTLHDGKNSRVDLKRSWYENYLMKKEQK